MNMSEKRKNSLGFYYAISGRAAKNMEERDEFEAILLISSPYGSNHRLHTARRSSVHYVWRPPNSMGKERRVRIAIVICALICALTKGILWYYYKNTRRSRAWP